MRWIAGFALISTSVGYAQFGGGAGDFSTSGSDAQRSSWIRSDPKISREGLQKPGFQLLWKVKLANEPKQLNSLSPAALLTRYIGYRGFRALGFVGGSADKVFAFDTDLGHIEWQKSLMTSGAPAGASLACPGGMTANLARPVSAAFPGGGGGRGFGGRGGAARSAVGEAGEGAVTLKEFAARAGGDAGGRRGGNAGPPAGPGGRVRTASYVHAVSSDGMFHSMYVSNGEEPEPAVKFLPPNANVHGLMVMDSVAYAVTAGACGGAPNAVWALDLASKQVASWQSPGGIAGSAGAAAGPDGTLFVTTDAGELVALESKTLRVKDIYKAGVPFTSSPLVFQHKESAMVAAAAKDGRIHVLDSTRLGGAVYKSPPLAADSGSESLATWEDPAGTRFLLASTAVAVAAVKVVEKDGGPALETAWTSRDITSPLTPLVINGVVFAVSSGEFRSADTRMNASQRAQRSTPAVLYALDGATGNALWNSGKTITSFVHGGGLSGGGSQVYLGTYDGTFYAFGFPIEH